MGGGKKKVGKKGKQREGEGRREVRRDWERRRVGKEISK